MVDVVQQWSVNGKSVPFTGRGQWGWGMVGLDIYQCIYNIYLGWSAACTASPLAVSITFGLSSLYHHPFMFVCNILFTWGCVIDRGTVFVDMGVGGVG